MVPAIFSVVPVEVWADRRLTLEYIRVLGVLLSFCGPDRQCWPSRQQIAERAAMHVANVSAATTALEKLGWLEKVGKGGHSKATRYTIKVPATIAEKATVARPATVAESASSCLAESATSPLADSATRRELTNELTSKQTTSVAQRGTRLPADWELSTKDEEWAANEFAWSRERCQTVAATFRDYWTARVGPSGRKLDWSATWRNWCRKERPALRQQSTVFKNKNYGQGGPL